MQGISGIQNISAILQFNDENIKVSIPKGNNRTLQNFKKQEGIIFTSDAYFSIFPVIASPLPYFIMNKWLEEYAYRINISWWMLTVAGAIALLIAAITISFQAIKAAIANPVNCLRSE
jgi:hypothetical protein